VAQAGAAVVVNDLDRGPAEAVVQEIVAAGGRAIAHVADISVWPCAEELIARCADEFGGIDGLVNNAGLAGLARLDELAESDIRPMIEVNLVGTINCSAHAARQMARAGRGSIVNVTSGAQMGAPAMSVYGATKGAVASLTYSWAMELRETGIRVNAVSPTAETRMMDVVADYQRGRGGASKGSSKSLAPETNTPVVEYLLSDFSAKITGQIVRIDGSRLALFAHPGVLLPIVKNPQWTLESIREAFAHDLEGRQLPLGLQCLEISSISDYASQ
jgi:NAD(P)-dependent dehydrogenase (short-subunit alcohol dehydrogenase family)